MEMRRGQVWWWNCPSHNRDHIQRGRRPVIIVSNDVCNKVSPVVTVVPMTASAKRYYPQQAPLVLTRGMSVAIADQLTSVPKSELTDYECTLNPLQVEQVERAVAVQLGFVFGGPAPR